MNPERKAVGNSKLTYTKVQYHVLGAFAKFEKTTISFVISVCLSRPFVRPHLTTRFPLGGFSWNFIFEHF